METKDLVLVTGGSGFLGAHCIVALIQQGYKVRTTVRSLKRADDVREMIKVAGVTADQADSVEFCAAELMSDQGWTEACKDCVYVLHVASPFPAAAPKHPDELIIPARDGTLRVLKAAKAAGTVRRVVVTSSFAAIGYGHAVREKPFTEEDWTKLDNPSVHVAAYQTSKTVAERAAWDWMAKEGNEYFTLSVVNSVGIYGPVLGKDYATSVELVKRLMTGQIPGLPNLSFGVVDVRDVADLHLRAMTFPKAANERFLAISDDGFITTKEIALKIKHNLGRRARKVPTWVIPDFVLRQVAIFDRTIALIVSELSKARNATNEKAKGVLEWKPRSAEEALTATAESLLQFGLVK